jgi:hypothetical protein
MIEINLLLEHIFISKELKKYLEEVLEIKVNIIDKLDETIDGIIISEESMINEKLLKHFEKNIIILSKNKYITDNPIYNIVNIIYLPINLDNLVAIVSSIIEKKNNIIILDHFCLKLSVNEGNLFNINNQNQYINLSKTEFLILKYMFKNYPNESKKNNLLQEVWNLNPNVETKTLESHIYNIRQKIQSASLEIRINKTDEGFVLVI